MRRLAYLLVPFAAACTQSDDPCAEMSAKLAACFPEVTTVAPTCDPAAAELIADSTCAELAAHDGKADDWSCAWMPWLSSCGDGGTSSARKIEVSTEECTDDGLCTSVTGAGCGLVTLYKDGAEVARGFTSQGGRFTFEGLDDGDYTVKVRKRDNTLARMMVSPYTDETTTASIPITVGGDEEPWARFELVTGTAAAMTRCADLDGDLRVKTQSGAAVDRAEVEWDWIVELETAGVVVDRSRPLFIESSSTPAKNVLAFDALRAGTYTLRFVRVEIPEYKQKPNPDYEALVRDYAADADPVEVTVKITAAQASGKTVSIDRTITDPLQ